MHPHGLSGATLAEQLRKHRIECEFADEDYLVLMTTPENPAQELERLIAALGINKRFYDGRTAKKKIPLPVGVTKEMTMREAYFSEGETVPVRAALGRICRMPMAACPPAIPVVVPGERVDETAIESFLYYGITTVEVVKCQK